MSNISEQREITKTQMTKHENHGTSTVYGTIPTQLNQSYTPKSHQNPVHLSITNILKTKYHLPNQRNLKNFISSIMNNIKYAWMKAKKDYKKSLKQRRLKHVKPNTAIHLKPTKTKIQKSSPFQKEKKSSVIEKIQKETSTISTQSTTFQSNAELLSTNLPEISTPYTHLKTVEESHYNNSLKMTNSIDQRLTIEKTKQTEESMTSSIVFLKEELENIKKRLQMFEQKYGLYDDLFLNPKHPEKLLPLVSSRTETNDIDDKIDSFLPIHKTSNNINNTNTLYFEKNHEKIFEDSSLETLSPIMLQNKNYTGSPKMS